MDFGDILNQWDKDTATPAGKKKIKEAERRARESAASGGAGSDSPDRAERPEPKDSERRVNPMDMWLRRYGTVDKDTLLDTEENAVSAADRRRRLRSLRPEATIDLHGLTRDEAWSRLELFFADSVRRGLKKVLIIHGKGTHSPDDPVLRGVVRMFLERNPHAGESGESEKDAGGSGSTWVILK